MHVHDYSVPYSVSYSVSHVRNKPVGMDHLVSQFGNDAVKLTHMLCAVKLMHVLCAVSYRNMTRHVSNNNIALSWTLWNYDSGGHTSTALTIIHRNNGSMQAKTTTTKNA